MSALRPVQHLESVSRDYPNLWKRYAQFLGIRRQIGDWPTWCFCPVAAALSIVSGGTNRIPSSKASDIARVAAAAAWRPTQGIYRFDPTLLKELLETPVTSNLPTEHLRRLPEWCVYVELDGGEALGFFAHLEYDLNSHECELMLLVDYPGGFVPIALRLQGTLEEAVAEYVAHANTQLARMAPPGHRVALPELARTVAPMVSILLYLCAEDAEMRPTRDPKRTHEPVPPRRNKEGELHLPPAKRPEVWETGFRLGAALRDAMRAASPPSGSGPRGHIRRAHWHSYWKGSKSNDDERQLEIRWLPPIPVNLEIPDHATVRNVRHKA